MTSPQPDEPPALRFLISGLTEEVDAETTRLQEGRTEVAVWRDVVARLLGRYGQAALLAGLEVEQFNPLARGVARRYFEKQLQFLNGFALEIQEADQWQAGWNARARMYAQSIGAPYWRGRTKLLPLPAVPKDGSTQCLTYCKCRWEIVEVEGGQDCFWRRSPADSCQTCIVRERRWAPLRIRNGEVQRS